MRWKEGMKSVTKPSVNDTKQLVQDKKKWCSLAYKITKTGEGPAFNHGGGKR